MMQVTIIRFLYLCIHCYYDFLSFFLSFLIHVVSLTVLSTIHSFIRVHSPAHSLYVGSRHAFHFGKSQRLTWHHSHIAYVYFQSNVPSTEYIIVPPSFVHIRNNMPRHVSSHICPHLTIFSNLPSLFNYNLLKYIWRPSSSYRETCHIDDLFQFQMTPCPFCLSMHQHHFAYYAYLCVIGCRHDFFRFFANHPLRYFFAALRSQSVS